LFDGVKTINSVYEGRVSIDQENLDLLKLIYNDYVYTILGLSSENMTSRDDSMVSELIESVLTLRQSVKDRKEWNTADEIRQALEKLGITVKDRKDGFDWEIK
jgi:cysteinyl-tRNA synthetase